jgi:DNA primase
MSKLAPTSIKYVIRAQINAKGVIEKPDVIGAIFGQTEGLLGPDLDLRELQRTGRIGRIEVNIKSEKGNSYGELIIPSSLDSSETALIAATLETIERIGPCTATIKLKSVEDTRALKRKQVLERAKSILKDLLDKGIPDTSKIAEEIKEEIKTYEITSYQGLPCGTNLLDSDEIIIVEGRADVVNLVKYGIKNVIAIEGSSIPQAIIDMSKEKITTAFFDSDRGGDLNLKGLLETADIDYVAQAPPGKEVEELSKKEAYKALRSKVSVSQFKLEKFPMFESKERAKTEGQVRRKIEISSEQRKIFKKTLGELIGTRAACIFDSAFNLLGKVPVKELPNVLKTVENPYVVIFDGKVDFNLDSVAKRSGIKYLVGMEKENIKSSVNILSKNDLEG